MMAPFATPDDVAVRMGAAFNEVEAAQVAALIDDVSAVIRAGRPDIDRWIAEGLVSADVVRAVTCQVVARVMAAAGSGGVGFQSETHPEYSYSLTPAAAAGLELTQREWDKITPPRSRERAFSIMPR